MTRFCAEARPQVTLAALGCLLVPLSRGRAAGATRAFSGASPGKEARWRKRKRKRRGFLSVLNPPCRALLASAGKRWPSLIGVLFNCLEQ